MEYEALLAEADRNLLTVVEVPLNANNGRIKGTKIAINKNLDTTTAKACILAEELGHYHTSVGNIIDVSQPQNAKQERHARLWAYNEMIGLYGLIRAYKHGCTQCDEIAEYLDVTEEFLCDAIECYRNKYGICKMVDNHIIYFIPQLMIGQMI